MKTKNFAVVDRVKAKSPTAAQRQKLEREVGELAKLSTESLLAKARPLTADERSQWNRARKGRPKKPAGQKSARVLFTIQPDLLKKADRYARENGLTRAELIATGLRSVIFA